MKQISYQSIMNSLQYTRQ